MLSFIHLNCHSFQHRCHCQQHLNQVLSILFSADLQIVYMCIVQLIIRYTFTNLHTIVRKKGF